MFQYPAEQEENVNHLLTQKKNPFHLQEVLHFQERLISSPPFYCSVLMQLRIAPLPAPVVEVSNGGVMFGGNYRLLLSVLTQQCALCTMCLSRDFTLCFSVVWSFHF